MTMTCILIYSYTISSNRVEAEVRMQQNIPSENNITSGC